MKHDQEGPPGFLREDGEALSTVLSALTSAVVVVDSRVRCVQTNGVARRLLGQSSNAKLRGSSLKEVAGPHLYDTYQTLVCADSPSTITLEHQGELWRWSVCSLDLREVRSYLFQGVDLTSELEKVDRVRADYAEALRRQSKAQARWRACNEYLGMFSHEVKTPANVIGNALDMLGETALTETQTEYFLIARAGAESLSEVVHRALDLARQEAHICAKKSAAYSRFFHLGDSLEKLLQVFSLTARSKGVRLKLDTSEVEHQDYAGDWPRVSQVLSILLDNALKFSPRESEVTLRVSNRNEPQGLLFQVIDQGPGIPAEKQREVFQPFDQGGRATRSDSVGLGLTIARRLCRLMDCELELSTSPQGCCFAFAPTLEPVSPSEPTEVSRQGEEFQGLKVLFVEDNPLNLKVVSLILERMGAEVTALLTPLEAIRAAQEEQYDCIVTDLGLPEMSGLEMLDKLHQLPHLAEVPVIVATGSTTTDELEPHLGRGISRILKKPFFQPDLEVALREALGRVTGPGESPSAPADDRLP